MDDVNIETDDDKLIELEWEKQVKLSSPDKQRRATHQEEVKHKLESTDPPEYSENDVYYVFQYHFIEHPIDWLFLPEEPYILIDLVNDQQAMYANSTLSIITEQNVPEHEIMPCYFAFKGMICLFVTKFEKAYDYFTKAYEKQEVTLFLFWKTVAKFYTWLTTKDLEHMEQ